MEQKQEDPELSQDRPARRPTQFVKEAPKFDLDSYISNYEGLTRLDRLFVIGTSSKPLGRDALRAGVIEAKQGDDVHRYQRFVQHLRDFDRSDELAVVDTAWVESKQKQVAQETARLENELRGYKNNLIKESIRMGNEDLGAYLAATGNLRAAAGAFSRMREYCTTPKHIAEMSLKLLSVALQRASYLEAHTQIYKIQNQTMKPEDAGKINPLLPPLSGLANMCTGQYRAAATAFVDTDPVFMTHTGLANIRPNKQILTPNDVAIYGGLCALASLSRAELSGPMVLENDNFRQYLELEPHLRRAIACFVGSKFTQCLGILESYRPDYLLDVYLQPHVPPLYQLIRRKSIVAYFAPFSAVALAAMADTFVMSEAQLEEELTAMIRDGSLDARLDLVDRKVVAGGRDGADRREAHRAALRVARAHEEALRLKLYKINMLEHGFDIKAPKSGKGGGGMGRGDGRAGR